MSKKDPNFLEGIWVGKQMLKNIDKTYYGTVENAIKKKKELAEDLPGRWRGGSTSQRPESGQIRPPDVVRLLSKTPMFRNAERLAPQS